MIRLFLPLVVTCLLVGWTEALAKDSVVVHVSVTGLRNNNGSCRLLLFGSEEGFPDSPGDAVAARSARILGRTVSFTVTVKRGTYAVVVLHDENANGEMDKTWYGKPREGFGTSGSPQSGSGPPEFGESTVLLDEKNDTLTIAVNYL